MHSDKPRLSVIMPVYNAERYVGEAIESILKQTYTDFELLIADDASTDSTKEVINNYAALDKRIKTSHNSKNEGKVKTANRLFECCRGDLVTVHDGDDISLPTRLQLQVDFMEKNKDFALVGCAFKSIIAGSKKESEQILETDYKIIKKRIKIASQFHGPTVVFRKSVVPEVGGLYRYFIQAQDIDFTMRVTEKYLTTNLPQVLYVYRILPDSLTNHIKYFNHKRYIDKKLLYHLAKQREEEGVDSLMKNEDVSILINQFANEVDPYEPMFDGISRLLFYGFYRNSIQLALNLLRVENFSIRSIRVFLYVLKKISFK